MIPTDCLVSVVILSWNSRETIAECLDSVFASDYPMGRMEVIVSDNASTDETVSIIKKGYPNVRLLQNEVNLGFSEGNNAAIRASKGEILVFLNDDTVVEKAWLKELTNALRIPNVGIVGSLLKNPPPAGGIQPSGGSLHASGRWTELTLPTQDSSGRLIDCDWVSGAAMASTRSVLRKIGLFDPLFFAYREDMDLCLRAKEHNYRVCIVPSAVVTHNLSKSWNKLRVKKLFLSERNRIYFLAKHSTGIHLFLGLTCYEACYWAATLRNELVERLDGDRGRRTSVQQRSKGPVTDTLARLVLSLVLTLLSPIIMRQTNSEASALR